MYLCLQRTRQDVLKGRCFHSIGGQINFLFFQAHVPCQQQPSWQTPASPLQWEVSYETRATIFVVACVRYPWYDNDWGKRRGDRGGENRPRNGGGRNIRGYPRIGRPIWCVPTTNHITTTMTLWPTTTIPPNDDSMATTITLPNKHTATTPMLPNDKNTTHGDASERWEVQQRRVEPGAGTRAQWQKLEPNDGG